MRVTVNDLETARFGVRFGRLLPEGGEPLPAALAAADAEGVDVVSARVDAADAVLVHSLEAAGFRIMDTLVYHRRALPIDAPPGDQAEAAGPRVHELAGDDAEAAAALAGRAFRRYLGHYHVDPRLDDDAADAAYADWAARLLRDAEPGRIALGTRGNAGNNAGGGTECATGGDASLTGFLIGRQTGEGRSEIVLNAVDPGARRGGNYAAMLRAYLEQAGARGDREVVISTQLTNYPVQRAWGRAGFLLFGAFHTLHRWRPAPPHPRAA